MSDGKRWAPGPAYGPVLRPTDLYLLEAKPAIHPILTHSFNPFRLNFNLATVHFTSHTLVGETVGFGAGDRQLTFTYKDNAATLPRLTEVVIITRDSPWCTIVRNELGVSLADVCGQLWKEYTETALTEAEFATLGVRDKDRVKRMALMRESGGYDPGSAFAGTWGSSSAVPLGRCRRIDWLHGKVYFEGLERDDAFAKSRLKYAAPNVFRMSLIMSRSRPTTPFVPPRPGASPAQPTRVIPPNPGSFPPPWAARRNSFHTDGPPFEPSSYFSRPIATPAATGLGLDEWDIPIDYGRRLNLALTPTAFPRIIPVSVPSAFAGQVPAGTPWYQPFPQPLPGAGYGPPSAPHTPYGPPPALHTAYGTPYTGYGVPPLAPGPAHPYSRSTHSTPWHGGGFLPVTPGGTTEPLPDHWGIAERPEMRRGNLDTRWMVGSNYGPVLEPLLVGVVKCRPKVNPLLSPPPDDPTKRDYLNWNMLFSSAYVQRSNEPQDQSWIKGRDSPATFPRLGTLRIISRRFPWFIDVRARDPAIGITCGDVIDTLSAFFSELTLQQEFEARSKADQAKISEAYHHNRSRSHDVPGGRMGIGLRRVEQASTEVMVKREPITNPSIDVETPRPKRRKDTASETPAVEAEDQGASSDQEQEQGGIVADEGPAMSPEEVQEEGLKVWQLLKDAVDKEGRSLSYDFLRLPSKRQFPDYYMIIKRPIALDDIKTQLDNYVYVSLEALQQDFEQCFKNAKKYNMRESIIWKDAKTLQKLAGKELDKIRRRKNDEGDGDGSDKETGKKKEKGANITRLMKNRLQKLTSKTEESTGRLVAADFMDLPSKKKWPVYYKIIKRPICFEDIFKRIKRKEYLTIPDFMNDVELVFTNAIQFNEEHSPIWEDTMTLKTYFRELMTDLPAKYNMNAAADDPSTSPEAAPSKILLKLPNHQAGSQMQSSNSEPLQGCDAAGGTVRLRVPALGNSNGTTTSTIEPPTSVNGIEGTQSKKTKPKSPAVLSTALPSSVPSSSSPALAVPTPRSTKAALPALVKGQQSGTQSTFMNTPVTPATTYHQYNANVQVPPQAFYTSSVSQSQSVAAVSAATPASASATPAPLSSVLPGLAGPSGRADAPTPAPPARAAGLHSVRLETHPVGRRLALLDVGAGVRSWVVRLGADEKGILVRDVRFEWRGDGERAGSEGEREGVEGAEGAPPPKKRGRGRPRKTLVVEKDDIVKTTESPAKSILDALATKPNVNQNEKHPAIVPAVEDVVVRFDGLAVAPKAKIETKVETLATSSGTGGNDTKATNKPKSSRESGEWAVDVAAGRHVLEVGRKGNSVLWRVYIYV
ncbi:hypothetical protein EW145_g3923 [Phellinidium pouzarii]|uniref:Bromo domain-containing protein n=1 Tax=Phellinidium pouzarii TaxID=167371 RepID=A0A4S4L5V9_9AGAM|nr:hypothetical protein EW145_g3923 [Phellinidium pouzarii]